MSQIDPLILSTTLRCSFNDTTILYMIQDVEGLVMLVVTFDEAGDPPGGQIILYLESTGLATDSSADQVRLIMSNDDNKTRLGTDWVIKQGYNTSDGWDPTTGVGAFAWQWAACCTDGMVLGPLPPDSWSMTFEIKFRDRRQNGKNLDDTNCVGIRHFQVGVFPQEPPRPLSHSYAIHCPRDLTLSHSYAIQSVRRPAFRFGRLARGSAKVLRSILKRASSWATALMNKSRSRLRASMPWLAVLHFRACTLTGYCRSRAWRLSRAYRGCT